MKKFLFTAMLVALMSSVIMAGPGKTGAFTEVGLSRPSALGGAFVSVADDSNSIFYNPAGMVDSEYYDFSFMHMRQKGIIPYNYASFVAPFNKLRAAGAALVVSGDEIFDEKTFVLSYAEVLDRFLMVIDGVSAGVNVKLQFAGFGTDFEAGGEDRVKGNAWGVGIDTGVLWHVTDSVSAGVMFRDAFSFLSWNTQYDTYEEGVPLTTAFGLTYRMKDFLITADITDIDTIHIGVEKTIYYFDIRGGYSQTFDVEAYKEYSVGLGFGHLEFGANKNMTAGLDVTYAFERLDNTIKVQGSFKFK